MRYRKASHKIEMKKRMVVKIGTSILARSRGSREGSILAPLVKEICELKAKGAEFILVTSGAIGAGMKDLGWSRRPEDIKKKQAAAAVGQVSLMRTYQKLFKEQRVLVGQVLLSRGDFDDRKRYLNAQSTLQTLLDLGVVPVINENDTVAVEEIKFGDNDQLSALVAAKMDADILAILSDVDGLYRSMQEKSVIPLVAEITPEIERLAGKESESGLGTGGMSSKIDAAKIATVSGVVTVVANGARRNVIADILEGKSVGTKFVSAGTLTAKEKWILFGAVPRGEIVVDGGAEKVLRESRKSLLAAGVTGLKGMFRKGDVVVLKNPGEEEFARGVISFSSEEMARIKGKKSSEIAAVLGRHLNSSEIIHRDSLVLI